MQRVLATLATTALLLIGGCGLRSYEFRLDKTLEEMKYQDRLNRNLTPAITKGKWEQLYIYLRPPKSTQPTKESLLSATEPGKFDLESSFQEPQKQSVHLLARVKRPKTTKKKEATPADAAVRKDFNSDLFDLLAKSYPIAIEDLNIGKFKPDTEKFNEYKRFSFTANDKNVEVYLYKQEPYEVALIFEYPKAEMSSLSSKIKLCLEAFAVGDKAQRLFAGGPAEVEAGAPAAKGGGAF